MFFVPLYYNALIGGDWCSGSTRDSDPLSVGSIPISPARKNTFAFADVFFNEAHIDVRKMNSPSAMICIKYTFKPIVLRFIRAKGGFHRATHDFINITRVRNLIKECKKYLFHSLYTKKHICICRCVFLMKHISMYEKFNDKRREIFSPLTLLFKSDNAPFKCIKYKHLFAESKCYVDPVVFVVNTHNYAFTEFVVFNSRANNYS